MVTLKITYEGTIDTGDLAGEALAEYLSKLSEKNLDYNVWEIFSADQISLKSVEVV